MAGTFGVVLTVTALLGLVVGWRRRGTGRLGLLWLGGAILALGPTLYVAGREHKPLADGVARRPRVPADALYLVVRLPVLSSFREADRLALLGLVARRCSPGREWTGCGGIAGR